MSARVAAGIHFFNEYQLPKLNVVGSNPITRSVQTTAVVKNTSLLAC